MRRTSIFSCPPPLGGVCAALLTLLLLGGCSKQARIDKALGRGKAYYEAGEREKAKITYLGVLRDDPQSAPAFKYLGLIAATQGTNVEAARFLLKAKELAPKDGQVQVGLARSLAALQQVPEARKEALAILQTEPAQEDALAILAETSRTPDDLKETEVRLQKLDPASPTALLVRASLAGRAGDLPGAEKLLEAAAKADPKSYRALAALGLVALQRNDLDKATNFFQRAAALAPPNVPASLTYAQCLAQKGDAKGADAYLEKLSVRAPDYIPLWVLRAQMALAANKPDDALGFLGHAFQLDPTNFEAGLLQGQVTLAKGEPDKAIDQFKRLAENPVYARMAQPRYEMARAYLLKSNPSQAMTALAEAVKLRPDYREAVLLLAQLQLQQGEAQKVIDSMKALLQRSPNLLPAQLLLSQAYRSLGNLTDAARVLREQLQATPQSAEPHLLLGLIALQQGKREDARQSFEAVRRIAPQNLLAAYQLVELDLADKKLDEALQRAEALVRELPDAPGAYFVIARAQIARQNWDAAEQALQKSIQLDSNFTVAYNLLVSIYVKNSKLEQASAQTEAFLARNPENAGALLTLGVIQEQMGNFDKARDTYQKAIDGNPNSATALNNLAVIYARTPGQLDKAYEMASRARTLQPEDGSVADTLGWIAYRRQNYQQAAALLQEGAAKLPGNAEAQYHYGMVSYTTGQTDAARAALTKAAAAPEDFPGKSDIPRALSLLGAKGGAGAGAPPVREITRAEMETIVQQQPADVIARSLLAESYEKDGDPAKAAALWEEAVKANPKLLTAVLQLAKLYAGPLHSPDKAFDYAKKARALAPTDPEVARLAGQAAYRSGNYAVAYSLLQETARQPAAGAELLRDFAWTSYYLSKVDEARRTMQRALDAVPNGPQTAEAKQFLQFTALDGKPQEVAAQEAAFEAALEQEPDNVPALMLRAALMQQREQADAAANFYSRVLELAPDFGPAQKRLAAIYLERPNMLNIAYDMAVKARKNLPDDPETAQVLAAARYQRKEYPSVVQLLQESAPKRPLDARLLFCLGMSRLQQKQKAEGERALKQALAAGLTGADAEEAKRALAGQPSL